MVTWTRSTCRPSSLVDTRGRGVERIVEGGVVVAGEVYAVDCLSYATGFEIGTDPGSWSSGARKAPWPA